MTCCISQDSLPYGCVHGCTVRYAYRYGCRARFTCSCTCSIQDNPISFLGDIATEGNNDDKGNNDDERTLKGHLCHRAVALSGFVSVRVHEILNCFKFVNLALTCINSYAFQSIKHVHIFIIFVDLLIIKVA